MKSQATQNIILAASAAFLGGVVVSLFCSPRSGKDNRKWVSDNKDEFQRWLDTKGKDLKNKTLPNLYEATEDLGLTEEDLIIER